MQYLESCPEYSCGFQILDSRRVESVRQCHLARERGFRAIILPSRPPARPSSAYSCPPHVVRKAVQGHLALCLEHPAQQEEALADCPLDGSERIFRKAFAVVHLPLFHVELEPGDRSLFCHQLRLRGVVSAPVVFFPPSDFLDQTVLREVRLLNLDVVHFGLQRLQASLLQYLMSPFLFKDFGRSVSPCGQMTRFRPASLTKYPSCALAIICSSVILETSASVCSLWRNVTSSTDASVRAPLRQYGKLLLHLPPGQLAYVIPVAFLQRHEIFVNMRVQPLEAVVQLAEGEVPVL